jgi:hypothetical protein
MHEGKAVPQQTYGGAGGRGGIAPLNHSALDGSEWLPSRSGRALAPKKGSPVPIGQEAGWAPEPVWT